MKSKLIAFLILVAALSIACGSQPASSNSSARPTPTTGTSKNGDYPGKGVVTKINLQNDGSIEIDHEEIKNVMPPMRMEFNVADKKMLDGIAIGDKVDFTLRYKDHTETTIVDIKKAQ
jgi:Cu(I)/Ag(I) efflux system periplasmic protein CusF